MLEPRIGKYFSKDRRKTMIKEICREWNANHISYPFESVKEIVKASKDGGKYRGDKEVLCNRKTCKCVVGVNERTKTSISDERDSDDGF